MVSVRSNLLSALRRSFDILDYACSTTGRFLPLDTSPFFPVLFSLSPHPRLPLSCCANIPGDSSFVAGLETAVS